MKLTESQIQKQCVAWFRLRFPGIEPLFFSVPNGGARNVWTGRVMREEGARAGVADLILLIPKGGYASLCIEMKTAKGKQSAAQVAFMELARKMRNKYVVCRSFDEFQKEVNEYLGL
jgi:VRR-NUC domain